MIEGVPLVRLHAANLLRDRHLLPEPTSLEVREGERLCISGPPSCGKSVLLEMLAGRHALGIGQRSYPAWSTWYPDAFLGIAPRFSTQLVSTEEQRRVSSRVASFHQARWHSQFTDPEIVETFLGARSVMGLNEFEVPPEGLIEPNYSTQLQAVADRLGIAHLLMRRLAALSNGEMRKVLLARAFLARPRLLLLDDPLGGIDPEARPRLVQALLQLCITRATGSEPEPAQRAFLPKGVPLTVVFATPRPEELSRLSTRTLTLESRRGSRSSRPHVQAEPGPSSNIEKDHGPIGQINSSSARAPVETLVSMSRAFVRVGTTTILHNLSFRVRSGEHWLVTGPNGSGKSTLLALLTGDHPQSYVADLEVLGMRPGPGTTRFERQRNLGFMAPELALHYPPSWTVREVVLSGFAASIGFYSEATSDELRITEQFTRLLDLDVITGAPFGGISEAQQRRVLLARSLVRAPKLLLLDEPTQGLTREERRSIHDFLDEIVTQRQLTLVLVSHHPEERPQCISHHLALRAGRVAFAGPMTTF